MALILGNAGFHVMTKGVAGSPFVRFVILGALVRETLEARCIDLKKVLS